jgi:hypothetical protein
MSPLFSSLLISATFLTLQVFYYDRFITVSFFPLLLCLTPAKKHKIHIGIEATITLVV